MIPNQMLETVAARLNTTVEALLSPVKSPAITWPRQNAQLMLHEEYGLNPHRIADMFGVRRHTVVSNLKTARQRRADGITSLAGQPCPKGHEREIRVWPSGPRIWCPTCQQERDARRRPPKGRLQKGMTSNIGDWGAVDKAPRQSKREAAALDRWRALRLSQLPESERRFVQG